MPHLCDPSLDTALAENARVENRDWEGAVCAQIDPELFFPPLGGNTRQAKAACAGCPAVRACLEYALHHDERYGVWGGKSVRERRRLAQTGTGDGTAEHDGADLDGGYEE